MIPACSKRCCWTGLAFAQYFTRRLVLARRPCGRTARFTVKATSTHWTQGWMHSDLDKALRRICRMDDLLSEGASV